MTDRYFDHLGARFAQRIYDSPKGAIRLAVLQRDLQQWLPALLQAESPLRILDIGAGLGQISSWLAGLGHQLTVAEPSEAMLDAARERINASNPALPVRFMQAPLQDLAAQGERYDLVICHAVLEWLADPAQALQQLAALVQPAGALSLAFYNRDALIYKNLVKGQFKKLRKKPLSGQGTSGLTPQQPIDPRDAMHWIAAASLNCLATSGVRVFYDYMPEPFCSNSSLEDLIEYELRYSQHPAYQHLGRYLHWWLRPATTLD
ncbi:methyltransferase domain-containing protein [Halopseudomonas aestusnigri]|uniref:tRNA 5-carboxymethoxyuridine methyltransferase n=1 Tax=Halopseudomonas aestusnigri TaxID=857252 RepID=A0AAQ1G4Z2_9GAMM|nr:methyltransferase domain-containing protein [Halopseudomonas aestusnigri]OWL91045.1 SAM-dependent methyltransferase [Halopseudomonas aestusnigri]SEF55578.1 S-adenosylmethionine-dependent methyltransferase [Halopseudomonas aestusnigri]